MTSSKESANAKVPVILIESTSLFREGLMRILQRTRFEVIEAAPSVAALSPSHAHAPELVLIGLGADVAVTSPEIEACRRRFPSSRQIVLSDGLDRHSLMLMLKSGVSACLGKTVTTEVLLMSMEVVTLGTTVFSAPTSCGPATERIDLNEHRMVLVKTERSAECEGERRLSARETAILHCLVRGEPNKLVARRFQITEATVKVHIKAILRKIPASNRTQAAIWAMNHLPKDQTSLSPEPQQNREDYWPAPNPIQHNGSAVKTLRVT